MYKASCLVFLGLVVSVFCQDTNNSTYNCYTGDQCKDHTSGGFSFINGVIYCCNSGDSMSIGNVINSIHSVLVGRRNIIVNMGNNLNCVCNAALHVDPETLKQIENEVHNEVNNILHSVSDSLNGLQELLGNL